MMNRVWILNEVLRKLLEKRVFIGEYLFQWDMEGAQ